jgi:hypothetical protein
MTATVQTASSGGAFALKRILQAGVAGGAVDFFYASILGTAVLHRSFARVWQGVASGWLGKAAMDAGWASALLGIVTHFAIATVMAAVYALVAARRPALYRRWMAGGALYGLILYGVMYGVVLPLRFSRPYHWNGLQSVGDIAAHVAVGLLIAFVLSRGRTLTPPA